MSRFFCVVFVFLLSCSLHAQERTWSDGSGKYQIEAELIGLQEEQVVLRKSDGKEILVPLERLSKDDQRFVKKWQADQNKPAKANPKPAKADQPGKSGGQNSKIKLKATAKREAGFDHDFQSKGPLPEVIVEVDIFGKAAAEAISYGKLKINAFKDDKGNDLEIAEREFGADLAEDMEQVVRDEQSFFGKHPRDGIRVALKTIDKAGAVKKISLVEGQIDVVTGGTPKTETIKDISTYASGPIDSAVLDELGLKCEFTRTASAIKLKVEGEAHLASMKVVDVRGKPIEPDSWSAGGWKDTWEYSFDFVEIPKADLVLDYRLNPETVTLPFSVKNVNVKPK